MLLNMVATQLVWPQLLPRPGYFDFKPKIGHLFVPLQLLSNVSLVYESPKHYLGPLHVYCPSRIHPGPQIYPRP